VKPWRVQAITRSLPPHALVVTPARLLALRANRHVGLAGAQDRSQCRWFSKPANLLVLDEPTNDLDIETLELLEEILLDFEGTILLVSHDRAFMDNVVTSLLVLDGRGGISEHVGGHSDWEARGGALAPAAPSAQSAAKPKLPAPPPISTQPLRKRKLSYKEQRELDRLPAEIQRVTQDLAAVTANLDAAYTRWDELEAER
jgi:ATP-binding cassette subfamily F protein uup